MAKSSLMNVECLKCVLAMSEGYWKIDGIHENMASYKYMYRNSGTVGMYFKFLQSFKYPLKFQGRSVDEFMDKTRYKNNLTFNFEIY